MKLKLIFIHILLNAISITGYSQILNYDFGARSSGIANANTTLSDEWSVINNVGGISGVDKGVVVFGYEQYVDIEGFDRIAAGIIQPFKFGSIGISTLRFGDELYSEQIISGAYGNKIGFVRLGLRVNYFQMRIDEFGSSSAVTFDLGGIVEMLPNFTFGAYISNFTVSVLNNPDQSNLPVVMKIGVSYQPTENIMINIDLDKDVEFDPIFRAGIEYRIIEKVFIRTGLNANPFKAFFGGGLHFNKFLIDYTVTSHQVLGISHQATVAYKYQK